MQLALGADIRIAHPDTKLSMREVQWGLIPDMTGTLMLSRFVRDDVMKDLVFTGRIPSAVRGAKQLINRILNAGAAEHFAAEREIIFTLIGKTHQVEAITANFENREPKFSNPS
jgi:enoyl-CoA hydratase/carnithine racemase